jgi:hypothetical protein
LACRSLEPVWSQQIGSASHFDPGLSAPFKSALPAMLQIKSQYAEENGALPDLDFTKPGAI